MQEAISTQSLGRLSRLGRILQPRHFSPCAAHSVASKEDEEEEGWKGEERRNGKGRGSRDYNGEENGRGREDESEEMRKGALRKGRRWIKDGLRKKRGD